MDSFQKKIVKILLIQLGLIPLVILSPWISYFILPILSDTSVLANSGLGGIGAVIGSYMFVSTVLVIGSAIIAGNWIKDPELKGLYSLLTLAFSILTIILTLFVYEQVSRTIRGF